VLRAPTAPVNVIFPIPPEYRKWYNQGKTPECVGYAWSIMQTTNNYQDGAKTWPRYDARALYAMACEIDGDPRTKPQAGLGTFLFAGALALRDYGALAWEYHRLAWTKRRKLFDKSQGIIEYWWPKRTIDEIRLCFSVGRPVMFGIVVYQGMLKPKLKADGKYWFNPNTGDALGLHALACMGFSDDMEAMMFCNSWGSHWPQTAWASFKDVENWLHGGLDTRFAEIMTVLDVPNPYAGALRNAE